MISLQVLAVFGGWGGISLSWPFPVMTVFFAQIALFLIPGLLTALLLRLDVNGDPLLVVALGIGFSFGETLLVGRLLLTVGADVRWLGYMLLAAALFKAVVLWRRPAPPLTWRITRHELLLMAVPLLMIMIYSFTVARINLALPDYPLNTWDKWSYITVLEQFRVAPDDLHLRPTTVIYGSNTRLAWNSWVYAQAAISVLTDVHPVQLIFQYFRPAFALFSLAGVYAFVAVLLRARWVALLAAALQVLFFINGTFERYLFLRFEEDKFVVYFLIVPLAWAFLLRALHSGKCGDLLGLGMVTCAAGLLHPIGVPGLLVTALPMLAVEWLFGRKTRSLRQLVLISGVMIVFLALPLLDRVLIVNTPYVQAYIAEQGDLPVLTEAEMPRIFDQHIASLALCVMLVPLMYFARRDQAARVLVIISAICLSIMLLPPLAAFMSRLVTSAAMERWNWLLPSGVVFAWAVVRLTALISERWRKLSILSISAVVCSALVITSGWGQWWSKTRNLINAGEPGKPMNEISGAVWDGFVETAQIIGEARAVTPVEYGIVAPTLWSFADVLIFNYRANTPEAWDALETLYAADDLNTAQAIIRRWQIAYILLPHDRPLYALLTAEGDGFYAVYANDGVTVFRVEAAP